MLKKIPLFLIFISFLIHSKVTGQIQLEFVTPSVTANSQVLIHAFAGGISSAQYQTIDLDEDDDLDLVVFDRSSDKINTFENTGANYEYNPVFEFLFPDNIQHWMVLADYDCDGRKDLFTYTNLGIKIYRNTWNGSSIVWDLVADPLKTQGTSSQINLIFNPGDFPSIADLDGDGDLDILVFDFGTSSRIEFHKNLSIENSGACALSYVRESRTYGGINECQCDDFTIDTPCPTGGRTLHSGGKSLLSIDQNADGLMDLVISQENCTNLNYFENTGSVNSVLFEGYQSNFPTLVSPLAFTSFPSAFYEDVTFDGLKDLIYSSNLRSNDDSNIDFQVSSHVFENQGSGNTNSFTTSQRFLQKEMIDVGEYAYPAIVDVDGDGQNDIVIGNLGTLSNGQLVSSLCYYKSDGASLSHQENDLFGLSGLGYKYIKPQFVDLNDDGNFDLVFSAWLGTSLAKLYYIINESTEALDFDISNITPIDFLLYHWDDYVLTDVDNDGTLDILHGMSSGRLDYYQNQGTNLSPTFILDTEAYLGITGGSANTNLSLTIGSFVDTSQDDLITTDRSGKMKIYPDFNSGSPVVEENILKLEGEDILKTTKFGRISKPAFGSLLGQPSVAIGSIQGGLRLMSMTQSETELEFIFKAFPVPTQSDQIVSFQSNLPNTTVEIFSLSGEKVLPTLTLQAQQIQKVDLSGLKAGLYIARAKNGNQYCSLKLVVSGLLN